MEEFDEEVTESSMDETHDESESSQDREEIVETMDAAPADTGHTECWADEVTEQLQRCCRVGKKRKFEAVETVDSEDENDGGGGVLNESDSDTLEADNKKLNVNPELRTEAFHIVGTNRPLLEKIFRYFTDDQVRSITLVTRHFRKIGREKLRHRSGNHPFVLLWKSKPSFKRFLLRTFLFEAECGVGVPVQAVILAATLSLQDSSLLTTPSTQLLQGVSCLLGLSDALILTTPDLRKTFEISQSSSEHACQALCIPRSDNLHIKGFAAIDRNANDLRSLYATLALPPPNGTTLKGVVLMFYQNEPELSKVIAERLSQEPRPVPLVGGAVQFIRTSENDSIDELAGGWALFGNEDLRVASYALEIDGIPDFEQLYTGMGQHFQGSVNGLILIFYSSKSARYNDIIQKIRKNVRDGIPVIGFQGVIDSLCFQGILPGMNPNYTFFTNADVTLKSRVKMVALFVAY